MRRCSCIAVFFLSLTISSLVFPFLISALASRIVNARKMAAAAASTSGNFAYPHGWRDSISFWWTGQHKSAGQIAEESLVKRGLAEDGTPLVAEDQLDQVKGKRGVFRTTQLDGKGKDHFIHSLEIGDSAKSDKEHAM